jgi:hypothetical protein
MYASGQSHLDGDSGARNRIDSALKSHVDGICITSVFAWLMIWIGFFFCALIYNNSWSIAMGVMLILFAVIGYVAYLVDALYYNNMTATSIHELSVDSTDKPKKK